MRCVAGTNVCDAKSDNFQPNGDDAIELHQVTWGCIVHHACLCVVWLNIKT